SPGGWGRLGPNRRPGRVRLPWGGRHRLVFPVVRRPARRASTPRRSRTTKGLDVARRRRFWNYPRPHKGPVQRWLPSWRIVVGTILTGTALGAGLFVAAWSTTTIPDGLDEVNNQATTVYWSDGKELGTFAEQKRELV